MADNHEVKAWGTTMDIGSHIGITYGGYCRLPDGLRVLCSCGWHNPPGLTFPQAIDAYADHKAAQHG